MEDKKKKLKKVSSKKITPKKRNKKPKNLDNSNEPQTKVKLGVKFEKTEVMDNFYPEDDDEGKSALQGLLRQLGGYDYLNPSIGRNRVNSLLEGLQSEDDDFKIQSLLELCDYLSISTEETLGSFRTDQFVPILIELLTYEYNPDIMLFATRALTYLIEALPSSAAMIVEKGAIDHFCLKLLSIEYMDVAEQTLQALEKLSEEHALALLKGGALTAILSYLDFFNTNVKRTSVATAANICKYIPHEHFDLVLPNVTHLNNLLRDHDIKIMEGGALCLSRVVKCFSNKKEQLESIGANGLISNLVRVLTGATPVSNSVITGLVLNTLGTLVKPSSTLTLELLTEGISSILASYLSSYSDDDPKNNNNIDNNPNNNVSSKNSDQPMVEYLLDTLVLIDSLLPVLPNSAAPITISQGNYNIPDDSRAVVHSDKEAIFSNHPYLLQDIGECLFSKVKEVFSGNVNPVIREECLSIIGKILYFSTSTMLENLLKDLATSSFVASLLISNNLAYVGTALRFADILIQKLPNIFQIYFRREGVFYEIDRLSNEPAASPTKNIAVMRSWIADQAQSFMKKYMDVDSVENGEDKFATAELIRLRALNNKLNQTDIDRNMYKNILVEIRSIILAKISTFEFLRSGSLSSLLTFFRTPRDEEDLRIRGEIFTEIFIADEDHTINTVVKLLTDCLNQHEQYPLILNDMPNKFASGLKYLVKPLKLKFEKDLDEVNLKEYTSSFVGIEPLATVGAIETFLWPRVKSDQPLRISAKEHIDESIIIEDSNDPTGLDQSDSDEQPVQDINATQSPVVVRKNPLQNSNQNSNQNIYAPSPSSQLSSSPSSLPMSLRPNNSDRKIVLFYHGKPLSPKKTTFQAIQEHYLSTLNDRPSEYDVISTAAKTWETVHPFTYKLYSPQYDFVEVPISNIRGVQSIYDDQLSKFLQNEIAYPPFPANDITSQILSILRIIEALYRFHLHSPSETNPTSLLSSSVIPSSTEYTAKFNNPKLSAKLNRQMEDALTLCSSAFPTWTYQLTSHCKFLFPYEVRKSFFISSSLGIARSLHNLQQHQMQLATEMEKNSADIFKVGRIQRQKVRISRAQLLECARRVMELCAHTKTILEVEYVGEVGTGVGPTMEFYTLVSHALQRKDLNLWTYQQTISLPSKLNPNKDNNNNDNNNKNENDDNNAKNNSVDSSNESNVQYVYSSAGLFPAPHRQKGEGIEKIEKIFLFIGRFIAKAIMDDRLLDIPFSVPFYKLLLAIPLSYRDIKFIDRQIGETIEIFVELCKLKRKLEAENPKITYEELENQLLFKGAKISDLGLTYVIPGSFELVPNGADVDVTVENLEDYVNLLTTTLLNDGILKQKTALINGFNDVFPIENLRIFTINELENLLCGWDSNNQDNWSFNNIMEAIACDHHYSTDSLPVQYFVSVVSELTPEQQRNFVLFVTGSTKLPVGGFKNLNPKLTIVRKEVDYNDDPNNFLPSVMTCMNYVKLPEYSSKEITRQRLLFAISEGLSSFHLS